MPVTGDFKGLDELRRTIERLGTAELRRDLCQVLAEEARTQVIEGFQKSRDPYGKPWAALTTREGQPLRDTGRLQNSYHARATATGFEISTEVAYAPTHQYGATISARAGGVLRFRVGGARGRNSWVSKRSVKIQQRQMVPEGDIGPIWVKALTAAAADFLAREVA